jgi:hypothetical protein
MENAVSATELLAYIERTNEHFSTTGEQLNEGAARVLRKLRERAAGTAFRRTYIQVPDGYAMWDVITDSELSARGYRDIGAHTYGLVGSPNVTSDTITYWTSEAEHGDELWVGEPMID